MTERDDGRRRWLAAWRPAAAAVLLAVLVWRVGTGPFLRGARSVDLAAVAVAVTANAVATAASAWRWRVIAVRLGLRIGLPSAFAAYYRAQFLNTVLPGGVLGDVHRGAEHGRDEGDVARGLTAVGAERLLGQAVQLMLAAVILLALPSPVRPVVPLVLGGAVVVAGLLVVWARGARRRLGPGAICPRWSSRLGPDPAAASFGGRRWAGLVAASLVVVIAHTVTFVVAARAAGVAASVWRLVPIALVVLVAMGIPLNVGGFGPREGVSAWVFGAAGFGAGAGVTVSVEYGVLVLLAAVPGAVVLGVQLGRRWWPSLISSESPAAREDGPMTQQDRRTPHAPGALTAGARHG